MSKMKKDDPSMLPIPWFIAKDVNHVIQAFWFDEMIDSHRIVTRFGEIAIMEFNGKIGVGANNFVVNCIIY